MKKLIFLLPLFLVFTACEQDPYPTVGEIVETPTVTEEPLPALAIDPIDIIEYKEGRYREYKIRVAVEEPGEPIVKIDNLPKGAEFDPATQVLKWRPGFFDGNDPNDPSIKERYYPITIWLRSTVLPNRQTFRKVNLRVSDVPQEIDIQTDRDNPSVDEGQTFRKVITINNVDYPQGPFKFLTKDLPPNLEITELAPNRFQLEFTPDYFHVNRNTHTNGRVLYEGKIIVANPANHIQEKDYSITVNDVRQEVRIVAPDSLEQGLDASFQVASYDLNREVAPTMELTSSVPNFGKFETKLVQNPNGFNSVLTIFWKDIPPRYNGTTQTISYRACVLNNRNSRSNCATETTKIKLVVRDRTPPKISRLDWPAGELVYLGFNEVMRRSLRITDQEDPKLTPKVEIFPKEMRQYVSFNSNRNTLMLQFNKSGVFQFNVKATSDYNMSSAESFIVEVFPENRKRTLLFADSTRDPEVVFYKDAFKDTMDIMNPAIQVVNSRNVADRDTVVITTSTLLDESVKTEVQNAIDTIKNVVIATPLYDALPEKFRNEMTDKYGLVVIGRYSNLPNQPPISQVKLHTDKKYFKQPKTPIKLKGNTTQESYDPLVFDTGLDDSGKICKGVIGLSENGTLALKVGVSCSRLGGGKITFLGTEWADFLTTDEDKDIPMNWFNTLLNNKF